MDVITSLVMANALVWLGLGAYLAFLAKRQKGINLRLKQLELLRNDDS